MTSAKNLILTEVSEIFHDIASPKDKMLEVNPNLESMSIHQSEQKMLVQYCKLYDKKAGTIYS